MHSRITASGIPCFNEAAGVDPADACAPSDTAASRQRRFNEAAGVDPADASGWGLGFPANGSFNEAAGVDPADAATRSPWQTFGWSTLQ